MLYDVAAAAPREVGIAQTQVAVFERACDERSARERRSRIALQPRVGGLEYDAFARLRGERVARPLARRIEVPHVALAREPERARGKRGFTFAQRNRFQRTEAEADVGQPRRLEVNEQGQMIQFARFARADRCAEQIDTKARGAQRLAEEPVHLEAPATSTPLDDLGEGRSRLDRDRHAPHHVEVFEGHGEDVPPV